MFSSYFAEVIFNIEIQVELYSEWVYSVLETDQDLIFSQHCPKPEPAEGLQPCRTDQLPLCYCRTQCSLKELLLGFKHSMTGQERNFLAITSFPGGKRLFERVLEKNSCFLRESYLCLSSSYVQGFELSILRYTSQVEILVALPGKTWTSFM